MAYKDLREFMSVLEKRGLLVRVKAEVDPKWEINGVARKLLLEGGPAALFENVQNHKVPVLVGLIGTQERLALALEMGTKNGKEITEEWLKRMERPISPRVVERGPCKENILEGDRADIDAIFPPVLWHKGDVAPYVGTLGMVTTKDPETGIQNVGIYRMMYRTKNETGLCFGHGQHGAQHLEKWRKLYPGSPMPVAVTIGADPAYLIVSGGKFSHPPGEDAYAGSLRKEPLDMVKCETCNLLVPATAEIILEGEVFPEEKKPDAPFGEYPGIQGGPKLVNVFHLKLITHRNNPIFHGTRTGWPSEGNVFWLKSLECAAYSKLKKITGVVDVHIPPPGVCFKLIISLRKSWRGQVNQIIQYVWGDPELAHVFKNVVVVDEHVDIHNPAHVEWAVATHVQPDRDIIIVPQCPELGLDPSQVYSKRGWTSKWGIDATIPTEAYEAEGTESPKLCDDPDIKARVEAQWEKYGINL